MAHALFTPFAMRGLELANRIVVAPMCQYSADDGRATDWHLMHLGQFAVSGVGLMFTEAVVVEARGRITPGCLGLYNDEQEEALARVVAFCRKHGQAKIGIQLAHAGRKASSALPWDGVTGLAEGEGGWPVIGPSPIAFADTWPAPAEMDREHMDEVRQAFVAATMRAVRLDADTVEVHGAHGYLLSSFLSPIANKRTDDYGGSTDNRMRFPLEVFAAVRDAWPEDKPLGFRMSATDWDDDGWTIEESVELARRLKELGCDFVDASSGGNTPNRPPVAGSGQGYQVPLAEQIKRQAGIATIAVGMIRDPRYADQIVESGKADLVALARGMLYEPHWAWRAAEELGESAAYPNQYLRSHPDTWPKAFPGRAANA